MPIKATLEQLAEAEEHDALVAQASANTISVIGNVGMYKRQLGRNISLAESGQEPTTAEEIQWKANWRAQTGTDPSNVTAWIEHLKTQDWLVERGYMDTRHYPSGQPTNFCNCPHCLPHLPA